jgi:hypothetical protein
VVEKESAWCDFALNELNQGMALLREANECSFAWRREVVDL